MSVWEVFTVQNDKLDLVDSLRRIVRDIKFKVGLDNSGSTTDPETSSGISSTSMDAADRKIRALDAVAGAKRDLLRHSLEMMVKQNMTTAERASNLYAKYLDGDMLVFAAIESYANDRDVSEFLDTLQILSNTAGDVLDSVMRDVVDETDHENTNFTSGIQAAPIEMLVSEPILTEDQLQLRGVIVELTRNSLIANDVANFLINLVHNKDYRIMSVYECYIKSNDGTALIDNLLKLDGSVEVVENDDNIEEIDENKDTSLLNTFDQRTVVDLLTR